MGEERRKEARKETKIQNTYICREIFRVNESGTWHRIVAKSVKTANKLGAGRLTLGDRTEKINTDPYRKGTRQKSDLKWCRGASVVKSTFCSCRRPDFGSQHPGGGYQTSITTVSGDLVPSSDFQRYCIYVVHTHITIGLWGNWMRFTDFLYCWKYPAGKYNHFYLPFTMVSHLPWALVSFNQPKVLLALFNWNFLCQP